MFSSSISLNECLTKTPRNRTIDKRHKENGISFPKQTCSDAMLTLPLSAAFDSLE